MDPRRPALRRHRRRRAATSSSAAGCGSRPPSTSRCRRRPRRPSPRSSPTPTAPTPRSSSIEAATGYVRAMVGGRDFFGTEPHRQAQPGHPGPAPGRLRRSSRSCSPPRSTQGIDPLDPDLGARLHHHPDGENAEPWRPCNYGGGGGGTVTIAEGTVRSYNTLYAQLDHAGRRQGGHGGRHALRDHEPARERAVRRCWAATTSPPWTWPRPTPPSPTAASRCRPCSSPGSPVPTARCSTPSSTSRRRCSRPAWSTRSRASSSRRSQRGTGTRAKLDRPAAGQDRHHRRQQGRLVRRLHPAARHRGVGGLPRARARRRAGPDAPAAHADRGHRRLVPRPDLAALHERGARRRAAPSPFPRRRPPRRRRRPYVAPPPDRRARPGRSRCPTWSACPSTEATAILAGRRLRGARPCPPPRAPSRRAW